MKSDVSDALTSVQRMLAAIADRLPYIVLGIIAFVLFYILAAGTRVLMRRFAEGRRHHFSLTLLLGRMAQSVIVLVGLLVALVIAVPGFTPGQLISILGIGSVAIGFAFRDVLQDFLAGILLLLSEPFRIGDQIQHKELKGTVEDVQTRVTYLRTFDNRRVVIPNSHLLTDIVTVNTAYSKRRMEYEVRIAYQHDITKARKIMLQQAQKSPHLINDPPPDTLVVGLDDDGIKIRLRWWVALTAQASVLNATDVVLDNVKTALQEEGISIPFGVRTVVQSKGE